MDSSVIPTMPHKPHLPPPVVTPTTHRVLVIDGDPQGTITKSDFGARDNSDQGESLGMSLLYGRHDLEPLIGVKPNLDVVAGGSKLAKAIAGTAAMNPSEVAANFQAALERLSAARGYDFVFIDSAPGEMPLLKTFMSTANYLVIPTMSDGGSLDAVEDVADSFKEARRLGASIALLGVVLFCADPNAHVHLPAVLGIGVAHGGRAAALGHHGVGLPEQRLGHHGHPQAPFPGLDHRAQTRAAGADHDHVVGVPLDLRCGARIKSLRPCHETSLELRGFACQPMNLRSEIVPLATSMM